VPVPRLRGMAREGQSSPPRGGEGGMKVEDAVQKCLRELMELGVRRVSCEADGWTVIAYCVPPSTSQGHEVLRIDVVVGRAGKDG